MSALTPDRERALAQMLAEASVEYTVLRFCIPVSIEANLPTPPDGLSNVNKLWHDMREVAKVPCPPEEAPLLAVWLRAGAAHLVHVNPVIAKQLEAAAQTVEDAEVVAKNGGNGPAFGPLDTQVVFQKVPVIDRRGLREGLRVLSENMKPCALVVRGPEGSGRTRAGEFITWYVHQRNEFIYLQDASTNTPLTLLKKLKDSLAHSRTTHDPCTFREPWKYSPMAEMVANWVRERARKEREQRGRSTRMWLGLSRLDMASPAMRELAAALVAKLSEPDLLPLCRLVLLAFPEGTIPDAPGASSAIMVDDVSYESIDDTHLESFLDWFFTAELKQKLASPTRKSLVESLRPGTNLKGKARVKHIGQEAEKLVLRLTGKANAR